MPIGYRFVSVPPNAANFEDILSPIVACDREVYGTDPSWQEGRICRACTATSNGPIKWLFSEAPVRCPRCDNELSDYWPIEGLLADYRVDAARP